MKVKKKRRKERWGEMNHYEKAGVEELFYEGKNLLEQAARDLPAIIQNGPEIALGDWLEWVDRYEGFINHLDDWKLKVKRSINLYRSKERRKQRHG